MDFVREKGKGKIVQTTVEEARDANAIWMKTAHELLKQKNLEKEEEMQAKTGDTLEGSQVESVPDSMGVNQLVSDPLQGTSNGATSLASLFRESMVKFYSSLKSQGQVPLLLVITFALILLLMQLSIVVLLSRPQQVQLIPQADYIGTTSSSSQQMPETMAWLEKRIHHLNDEMLMIETILERMRQEHAFLKAQLKDLEHFRRQPR